MIKEDYFNSMGCFIKSAPFAQKRSYGLHTGNDFKSIIFKDQAIYNLFSGRIVGYGTGRDSGDYITIVSNSKFLGGVDCDVYITYKHLDRVSLIVKDSYNYTRNRFIESGKIIGKMGNTGYCMTQNLITKKWRLLTDKERDNPNCKKGVHVHVEMFEYCEKSQETELLKELYSNGLVPSKIYPFRFWQWDKLYYNPDIVFDYLQLLRGRKRGK